MSVSGFFRHHPQLRRTRPYQAIFVIVGFLLILFLAARALGQSPESDEAPGPVITGEAVPFRPGLASTGRLDFEIVGVREIPYDRGRRKVTATIGGNVLTLFAEKHPGALFVIIKGTGGEVRADNWHRPSGQVSIWQTLSPISGPLKEMPATARIALPWPVDSSPKLTIWILSAADIEAAGSIGLALQGR